MSVARKGCAACGRTFQAKNGRHKFCSGTCRARGHRGAVVALDAGGPGESLEESTRRQLEAGGCEQSPAGRSALLLARRLDQGGDTGSAVAALARQHLASLEEALRDATPAGDPVNELRERRRRRHQAG